MQHAFEIYALRIDINAAARYPLRLFLDCSTAHLSPAARAYVDRTDVVAPQSDAGPP